MSNVLDADDVLDLNDQAVMVPHFRALVSCLPGLTYATAPTCDVQSVPHFLLMHFCDSGAHTERLAPGPSTGLLNFF